MEQPLSCLPSLFLLSFYCSYDFYIHKGFAGLYLLFICFYISLPLRKCELVGAYLIKLKKKNVQMFGLVLSILLIIFTYIGIK